MEEKKLNFKDVPVCYSQQTIVKILRQIKYHFEPVSEYENTQFVCVTEVKQSKLLSGLWRFLGFKVKDKYFNCPLALTICGNIDTKSIDEIMVFTRDDIQRILKDVPENYTGDDIL